MPTKGKPLTNPGAKAVAEALAELTSRRMANEQQKYTLHVSFGHGGNVGGNVQSITDNLVVMVTSNDEPFFIPTTAIHCAFLRPVPTRY